MTKYKVSKTQYAGRGLSATEHIETEQVIETYTKFLTAQDAAVDPAVKKILKKLDISRIPGLTEKILLTLYLTLFCPHTPNTTSKPKLELDFSRLPGLHDYQTPVADVDNTEEYQKCPALYEAIKAKRMSLVQQYYVIMEGFVDPEKIARRLQELLSGDSRLLEWQWADSIVSSRCLGIASAKVAQKMKNGTYTEGDEYEMLAELPGYRHKEVINTFEMPKDPDLVLVLGLDYCNHSAEPNARWELNEAGAIELVSTRDISPGEEITISYGPEKANQELYYAYKFTQTGNPNWMITMNMIPDDEPANLKHYWATARSIPVSHRSVRFTNSTKAIARTETQIAEELELNPRDLADSLSRFWTPLFALDQEGTNNLLMLYLSSNPQCIQNPQAITEAFLQPLAKADRAIKKIILLYTKNAIGLFRSQCAKKLGEPELPGLPGILRADEQRGAQSLLARLASVEDNTAIFASSALP